MFLMMPSTKIAQTVMLHQKRAASALNKKYLQLKSHEPLVQNQNNFTEMLYKNLSEV